MCTRLRARSRNHKTLAPRRPRALFLGNPFLHVFTMRTIAITAVLMAAGLSPAAAQTITGRVVDATTNARVRAAEVMIVQIDSSAKTLTDTAGAFRFRAIPGMWTLRVHALGYEDVFTQPLIVGEKEHLSIIVLVSTQPIEIAPLTVIARSNRALTRLEEFHDRMKKNAFGYFLDQKAIERMPAFDVSDLLRRVPGAWVERNRVMMRGCEDANYLIDGMPVYAIGEETATEAVNAMLSTSDIAGIEVYRGDASIPPQLAVQIRAGTKEGTCGLVAIWTKR
jgi:hypothetical protein